MAKAVLEALYDTCRHNVQGVGAIRVFECEYSAKMNAFSSSITVKLILIVCMSIVLKPSTSCTYANHHVPLDRARELDVQCSVGANDRDVVL